jgi:plastocyanin
VTRPQILLLTALTLTACKQTPTPQPEPSQPKPDPATLSTLTGAIHFTGPTPTPIPIDMSADPACAFSTNLTEQLIVANHALANVYIYIKSGLPASSAPASTPPVVLDQKGCRYSPHVIALQQGASVEFHNSDPTMHNIHTTPATGPSLDISQTPMGAPDRRKFTTPQTMLPIRCNNHPWMNAFLNVAPNPYFAISATDGAFAIPNLPPGTYTLAAVHETLGEQDLQITIPPKSTIPANFTFASK